MYVCVCTLAGRLLDLYGADVALLGPTLQVSQRHAAPAATRADHRTRDGRGTSRTTHDARRIVGCQSKLKTEFFTIKIDISVFTNAIQYLLLSYNMYYCHTIFTNTIQ